MTRFSRIVVILAAALIVGNCAGVQSALDPSGPESRRVAWLAWVLFAGGGAILLLICVFTASAIIGPAQWKRRLSTERTIIIGGIAFPVVVLTALLIYGFSVLGAGAALSGAANPLRIFVVGEQFWWRVIYQHEDGSVTESANELRIPTGRPIRIELTTADVIHSFWVPAYAGKVDMVPGRTNILHIEADNPGVVRGQCAEYCGGAHALMAFNVIAMELDEFERWLAHERSAANSAADPEGARIFARSGCGACHAVRGMSAEGRIGPDLTHVGARRTLGAGVLPNNEAAFKRWISRHQQIKPQNRMPIFQIHSESELEALARYLDRLE